MKRHKLSRRKSRKVFKKGVKKTKAVNIAPTPMRGGFRM